MADVQYAVVASLLADYPHRTIEFVDDTLVSFRFKASVAFSTAPELSTLKGGNIVSWKELRPRLGLCDYRKGPAA